MNNRQRNALEIPSAPNSLSHQTNGSSSSSRVSSQGYSRPLQSNPATIPPVRSQENLHSNMQTTEQALRLTGDTSFNMDTRMNNEFRTDGDHQTEQIQTNAPTINLNGRPIEPEVSMMQQQIAGDGLDAQLNVSVDHENGSISESEAFSSFLRRFLSNITKWNYMLFLSVLFLLIFVTNGLNMVTILCVGWLHDISNLIFVVMRKERFEKYMTRKLRCLRIVEIIMQIGFKVALLAYFNGDKSFYITGPYIPLALYTISFAVYQYIRSKRKSTKFIQILTLGFNIFITIQSLTIALKLDNVVNWRWREVLWAYWVTFSIMIGFTFASLLMSVNKCCALAFSEIPPSEILGVFWVLFLVAGQTILSCVFIINLLGVLDQGGLAPIVIALMCYTFLFATYTLVTRRKVLKFLKKSASSEDNNLPIITRNSRPAAENKKDDEKPFEIPKFLTKSSSTFFRRANETEIKTAKEKQEYKRKKKQMAAQLKATQNVNRMHRNNSLDYSRLTRNTTMIADTTTQMNLLTLQTTDREFAFQNQSRLDGGETTTGRGMHTGRSGITSIVPNGIQNNHQEPDEERKEDSMVTDTINNMEFPNLFNLKDLNSSRDLRDLKAIKDVGSQLTTPQTDTILSFKERPKFTPFIPEERLPVFKPDELVSQLENSLEVQSPGTKEKLRKVQSVKVIPKPMYITMNSPHPFVGDEPVPIEGGKVDADGNPMRESVSDMKSPEQSQTQEQKCLVCFDKEPDSVFMECGHGGLCYECSLEVWKTTNECYLCRDVLQVDFKHKLPGNVIKVISATQMIVYEEEEDVNNPDANQAGGEVNEEVVEEIEQT